MIKKIGLEKNSKAKKVIMALGMVGIIFLAAFVVITQSQISELKKENESLYVKILIDEKTGVAPFKIKFSSLVTTSIEDLDYHWDFGDNEVSNEKNPEHIYEKNGSYICSLKVTDSDGMTKTDSVELLVKKNKPPVVTLSINQNTINREFNWLEILSLTPIAAYAGNQQMLLDVVENKQGPDIWGEGRLVVTAQIMDPEDDEIVSYDWKVQTSDSLVSSPITGSKEWLPIKNLTGEETVTIPELYAWMANQHLVILTVTDSAGNVATADIQFTVSQSLKLTKITGIKNGIKTGLPFLGMLWGLQFVEEPVTKALDEFWFGIPPTMQNLILTAMRFLGWDYEPPVPKANLEFSAVDDLNFSTYVNNTGVVQTCASVRSDFIISNNDSSKLAENICITLDNPFSDENGLAKEIEVEDLIVDLNVDIMSSKLFNNGKYTNWENCYTKDKLATGDFITLGITVTLNEGAKFNKGSYPCKLYIYQTDNLDNADYLDEIPFTIII